MPDSSWTGSLISFFCQIHVDLRNTLKCFVGICCGVSFYWIIDWGIGSDFLFRFVLFSSSEFNDTFAG